MNPNGSNQPHPEAFPNKMPANFPHFLQYPISPAAYQMFAMQSLSPIALQQLAALQFFRHNFASQQNFFQSSPPAISNNSAALVKETPPACIVLDDELTSSTVQGHQMKIQDVWKEHEISEREEGSEDQTTEGKVENDPDAKIEGSFQQKQEVFDDEFEEKLEYGDYSQKNFPSIQKPNIKSQLKEIIAFILEHHGQLREADLEKERKKYQSDPVLSVVFEALYSKYSNTFKTRAEIVKYITRKAFSTIKNNSKNKVDSSTKEACETLCKRYFQTSTEELQSSGVDIEKRESFLQLLFPYQKNSKNKVHGTELITKLMSSKEFYEDYCLYVKNLDSILDADNNRKLPKFIAFILNCIKKNQIDNITKYKRVPWLKSWMENTKSLARELAFNIQWKSQQVPLKQVKRENPCNKENLK